MANVIPIRPRTKIASLPAPVGGWNARDSYAEMGPTDAVVMQNYFPLTTSVALRFGHTRFATGMTGQCETVMAYAGGSTNKLFSANSGGRIYNISSGGLMVNYLNLPGAASDYASTPDSAALDITGDIEIIAYVLADDYTPGTINTICAKWITTGNQRSYLLQILTNGILAISTSVAGTAGTIIVTGSTIAPGFTNGVGYWVKINVDVDNGAGGNTVTFSTSTNPANTAVASIAWEALGSPVINAGTTSIFDSTSGLEIGSHSSGTAAIFDGKIYRVLVYAGIGGTLKADFNANDAVTGAATVTSAATSEVYTLFGVATISGALDVISLTNGRFQYINVATTGGNYLMAVNGSDKARYYTGTVWAKDGDGAPYNITGVDSATCIAINVHKNRVWLIEKNTLKAWYLPTASIGGAAALLDLRAFAPHGGGLVAMGTWTMDAGYGVDDYAVFITSKGDVIVYRGTDPASATTWAMQGQWWIGSPVGVRPFVKWRGDLLIICQDGVFPLSSALLASRLSPNAALTDKIKTAMTSAVGSYGANFGWQLLPFPKQNMLILNVPVEEGDVQEQYVMNTITGAWSQFQNLSANCWELFSDDLYFGGNTYVGKAWNTNSDNGSGIDGFVLQAFNDFKEPGQRKRVTSMRPLFRTNGSPTIYANINWDYDLSEPTAALSTTTTTAGVWDTATWDNSVWGGGLRSNYSIQSATGSGWVGAPVFKSSTIGMEIELVSNDISVEIGGFL